MDGSFDDEKLLFYSDIRNDDLVKRLGAEQRIRNLVELMAVYLRRANQGYFFYLRNNGIPQDDPGAIPLSLAFYDVKEIAYAVATHEDERGFFKRVFKPLSPLDYIIADLERHHAFVEETEDVEFGHFDDDTAAYLAIAMDPENIFSKQMRTESLTEVITQAVEHVQQQSNLLRLADNRVLVHDENIDDKMGVLTIKQSAEIAEYFRKQAKINGILFKTLHLTCLNLIGAKNPVQTTEQVYQGFMEQYKQKGMIFVGLTMLPQE